MSDAETVPIPEIPPGECDLGPEYTTCMSCKFGWAHLRAAPTAMANPNGLD